MRQPNICSFPSDIDHSCASNLSQVTAAPGIENMCVRRATWLLGNIEQSTTSYALIYYSSRGITSGKLCSTMRERRKRVSFVEAHVKCEKE